ncbi:hypothetical protein [Petroclostridium sp. X23]|uniref:coiled-coil domain-containing protein n=1 Tax=Petroclostridium sp. X23 TaxID=3045146 RepID=UPI0024AD0363|nr:hypothetical protein [Petroclostridium sp. X23]WHH57869.1 hypothetical protein QKW49_18935 [Petroclostridium sp. X23]
MFKPGKGNLFIVFILTAVFACMILYPTMIIGQADSFSEMEKKLEGISQEKKEIIKYLFDLEQEIERMEAAQQEISREIEGMAKEIKSVEASIADEEAAYQEQRDILKQVLKSYQKRGPGSYLEIILDSDNLTVFLRRLGALRDLTRNTGELLESLDASRDRLAQEKATLAERLILLQEKQQQLDESLSKKVQLKEDKETYLASLEEEREYYQQQVNNIQYIWDQFKPLFSDITREVSRIIEEGNLPPDALKISLTANGIKGSIEEKTFNNIIAANAELPQMVFSFYPGEIEMKLPQKHLILKGSFVILQGNIIEFQVKEGSFYGVALDDDTLEELFKEGQLVLNLKPLVGTNILNSVEALENRLEFGIKPVF